MPVWPAVQERAFRVGTAAALGLAAEPIVVTATSLVAVVGDADQVLGQLVEAADAGEFRGPVAEE